MRRTFLIAAIVICWTAAAAAETADDYNLRARHADNIHKRLALLDKALAINPNHVPALTHRARVHLALGDKELAFADGRKAAELVPGDPELNFNASVLATDLKKHEEAARFSGRAVAADRTSLPYRQLHVSALIKALKTDEAVVQAEAAVKRHPENLGSYLLRAEAYEWTGRYKDAIADLTHLIQMTPRVATLYAQRSGNYRAIGDGKSALADAMAALRRGRRPAGGNASIGNCYEELGQLERALEFYAKAAKSDSQKEYYKIWSCIILRKLGRRQEADKFIKDFRKVFKNDEWIAPVVRYLTGEMTEEQVFQLAKDDDPETNRQQLCEAYYYIGACHLADKKLDKAEGLMKKCLEQRVVNFYEHGFAIRDLRTIKKLRKEAGKRAADNKTP